MSNKKPRYENSDRNRVTPRQSFFEALKAQEELRAVPAWRAEKNYYLLSTVNRVRNFINNSDSDKIEHLGKKRPIPAFGSLGSLASWLKDCNPKAAKELFIYFLWTCCTDEISIDFHFYKGLQIYMMKNQFNLCKKAIDEIEETNEEAIINTKEALKEEISSRAYPEEIERDMLEVISDLNVFVEEPTDIFARKQQATATPEEAIAQIVEDTNEIFSNLENPLEK